MTNRAYQSILAVSKDSHIYDILKEYTYNTPINPMMASDVGEAVNQFLVEEPDIILMDVSFPEDEQQDILQFIKKESSDSVNVIMLNDLQGTDKQQVMELIPSAPDSREEVRSKEDFLDILDRYFSQKDIRGKEEAPIISSERPPINPDFGKFKKYLLDVRPVSEQAKEKIMRYRPSHLHAIKDDLSITEAVFSSMIASFLGLPHVTIINHGLFRENVLPHEFCHWNSVAPIITETGDTAYLLSNPFDQELLDVLRRQTASAQPLNLVITTPKNIRSLIDNVSLKMGKGPSEEDRTGIDDSTSIIRRKSENGEPGLTDTPLTMRKDGVEEDPEISDASLGMRKDTSDDDRGLVAFAPSETGKGPVAEKTAPLPQVNNDVPMSKAVIDDKTNRVYQSILAISRDRNVYDILKHYTYNTSINPMMASDVGEAINQYLVWEPVIVLIDISFPEDEKQDVLQFIKRESENGAPVIMLNTLHRVNNQIVELVLSGPDSVAAVRSKKDFLNIFDKYYLKKSIREKESAPVIPVERRPINPDFGKFKRHLLASKSVTAQTKETVMRYRPSQLYTIKDDLSMTETDFSGMIASFLGLPHAATIHHEQFQENIMPRDFCHWNSVAPIVTETGDSAFLLSNPFDWELLDVLRKNTSPDQPMNLIISAPKNIHRLIDDTFTKMGKGPLGDDTDVLEEDQEDISVITNVIDDMHPISEWELERRPIIYVSNNILYTAVSERASDIHVEPKENDTVVRFRIDGDLRDMFNLKKQTGAMVISRLKAFAGLDIAERMRPQDGSVEVIIGKRKFKLRLASTSTPNGESLIIRILEPAAKPKELNELGMTDAQVKTMMEFATRRYGLILIVGPTGAGKTTTIYSFLSHVDTKTRSLISVEDPVEYRIPNANQQQVNDKAGVTFEALLKSSVRQDPDILYLGEIRDNFSARISVDFASTGHMTISTLHTNNATTAIFRLERLGVTRDVMADSLLGVVAQRLFKKLCPHCKRIEPITPEEAEMLSPFVDELPSHTAHPVGCDRCLDGYSGREGVYEIIAIDAEIAQLVRSGAPVMEIREFIQRRRDYLIANHAAEKAKALIFPVKDVYEKILVEEIRTVSKIQEQTPDGEKIPAEGIQAPQKAPEQTDRALNYNVLWPFFD
ncbi:MAG: ATPase, T2SS/T4P/T4SS family [Syntrophales bacterium]|nr:ATPase, T2SS/T4P/T4SS family [Syntrophales bacterium]